MQKRGLIVLRALAGLVASAIIIYVLVSAGTAYGAQEVFYKLAIARDLALTIDIMYALPGNLEFTYPNDVSGYHIEIKGNLVRIYSSNTDTLDPTAASYSFVSSGGDVIDALVKEKRFVKLEKIGNKISITGVEVKTGKT